MRTLIPVNISTFAVHVIIIRLQSFSIILYKQKDILSLPPYSNMHKVYNSGSRYNVTWRLQAQITDNKMLSLLKAISANCAHFKYSYQCINRILR